MQVIIVHEDFGHWTAWFASSPASTVGANSMKVAVDQLVRANGLDPADVRLAYHGISAKRHEFRIATEKCADCRGTGRYTGFHAVEDCQQCRGAGWL